MWLLFACTTPDPTLGKTTEPTTQHTGDSGEVSSSGVTGDTGSTPPPAPGVVVLAGGGAEGERGDDTAWSAQVYRELFAGGDVSGDGRVTVAILSNEPQTGWLAGYFESLGADAAFDVLLPDRAAADDPGLTTQLADVDAFFLKGGDQGIYYDQWNDLRIEAELRRVHAAGGGVGGTSAGAMSMAGVALAGGEDLVSSDVLADACTPYLDDASDGGSALHEDFLGFVPGAIVDTHVTVRGRLGRMVGTLAKAVADGTSARFVVGVDERTGLVIRDGTARVLGVGAVTLVVPGSPAPTRTCGQALGWTDLRLDSLVAGWSFDLDTLAVTPGSTAEAVVWDGLAVPNEPGTWYVDGDLPRHEARFGWVVDRAPDAYGIRPGTDLPVQADTVGVLDAHDSDRRGAAQEALLHALVDLPGVTGFAVGRGASVTRTTGADDGVEFVDNPADRSPAEATLVFVTTAVSARDTAPSLSNLDVDGTLRAAGLAGVVLHVLGDTGVRLDTRTRTVTP